MECTDSEVSVTLVNDDEIRILNNRYLQRDRPTNVISFSMREGDFGDITPTVLGDIVVSAETAARDARAGDIPADDMILYLVIHGLLHLLGYDHEASQEEAVRMRQKENELFFALRNYHLEQK
ncbi:MAG: rRNA maturation RNase YbeY [delta proteobacterium MLS_D]|nr:MAG: rRNA maturation RNase YbeY [delta proteobacterium MLS_D]